MACVVLEVVIGGTGGAGDIGGEVGVVLAGLAVGVESYALFAESGVVVEEDADCGVTDAALVE